jgi:hypothetical protein
VSDLQPFDASRACAKCGGFDVSAVYMEAEACRSYYRCKRREEREHLHRTCRRCGYCWDEASLCVAAEARP